MIDPRLIVDLSVWAYLGLRNEFWSSTAHTVENYLLGKVGLANAKHTFKRSMRWAYDHAAKEAWVDGGGELPLNKEVKDYLKKKKADERAFIDDLFSKLKDMRDKKNIANAYQTAIARADGYARSLDIVYSNVKIINAGKIMLLFTGEDGQETCTDCMNYKGKWHTAKWWRDHDAVPPNRHFECKGFKCMHYLADKSGKIYTL